MQITVNHVFEGQVLRTNTLTAFRSLVIAVAGNGVEFRVTFVDAAAITITVQFAFNVDHGDAVSVDKMKS